MPKKPEETSDNLPGRLDALKKAGVPTVWIVVITLFSTPGFYTTFFDDTAEKKTEASYTVLVKEIEHLREDDKRLEEELLRLRAEIARLNQNLYEAKRVSLTPPSRLFAAPSQPRLVQERQVLPSLDNL